MQVSSWYTGQPLGVFPKPKLDQNCIAIPSGSTLVLYTDGALDAQNEAGAAYGPQRLEETLRASLGRPAATALHQVIDEITAFRGSRQQFDDITLVMLRGLE
jgi:sigma-B regulation protein RsbU (phosphoserine phosphatase)